MKNDLFVKRFFFFFYSYNTFCKIQNLAEFRFSWMCAEVLKKKYTVPGVAKR